MLGVLRDVLDFAARLEKDGRITSAQVFVTTAGDNRDTLMLLGELSNLAQLLIDDAFEAHLQDGMLVVQDITVSLWAGGAAESLSEGLQSHAEKLASHGLI